jgi:DNA repair protein RadD
VHQRVLVDLGMSRAGYDIARAVGARGNNADALFAILNDEINKFVGEERGSRDMWTEVQYEAAYDSLDEIGDEVVARIRAAVEGKNASR